MDAETMDNRIKSIIEEANADIAGLAKASQKHYLAGLQPGEIVPEFEEFDVVGEEAGKAKHDIVSGMKMRIYDVLDEARAQHLASMTASASADDVATVQLALSRDNIDAEELQLLYDKFGSNYQLGQAIRERADRDGCHLHGLAPVADAEGARIMVDQFASKYRRGLPGQADVNFSAMLIMHAYEEGAEPMVKGPRPI